MPEDPTEQLISETQAVIDEQSAAIDLQSPEFQDYDGPSAFELGGGYDWSLIWSESTLRALAAMVAAILIVAVPSASPRLFGIALAVILIAWSVGGTLELIRGIGRDMWTVARIIVLIGIGIALIVFDEFDADDLGKLIGIGLMLAGAYSLWGAYRERNERRPTERLLGILFYLAIGFALFVSPSTLLQLALLTLSIYWFFAGMISVASNLREDTEAIPPSQTWSTFMRWVSIRPNTADDRIQLYDKVFFEGEVGPRRLSRFFTLMGFATAIAAFGIIADSTAVVIGAMLVAPLMTPLMGTALALVMGWPRRVIYTGLVALGGVAFSIALSVFFGLMVGLDISPVLNSQVSSRVAPNLIDLLIAMAAGGAGAFALSRPDVSDSLPGVAVAIALVPPLAVVGLMIAQGDLEEAIGALLLFTTNMIAILLVGGLVFVLTGVVPLFQISRHSDRIKKTLGLVALFGVLVIAALGVSTTQFQASTTGVRVISEITEEWIGDQDLDILQVTATATSSTVTLSGPEEPADVDALITDIQAETGDNVEVTVNWFQRTTFSSSS